MAGEEMRTAARATIGAISIAGLIAGLAVTGCRDTPVGGRPPLTPNPASVFFSVDSGVTTTFYTTVDLTYPGAETVMFSATTDQAWLSVAPASGFVGFGGTFTLGVFVDTAGLADGLWVGHVFVEDVLGGAGGGVVTVSLYVGVDDPAGLLASEPNPVGFSAALDYTTAVTKEVTLTYTGDAAALVSAGAADTWLTTDLGPDTSMSPGGTVTVTLTAATGRTSSLNETTVTFTTAGGEAEPLAVPVTFAVLPRTAGVETLLYYRSRIDQSLQPYGLRLPATFTPGGGPWPVAFHMHGYPGAATAGFGAAAKSYDWILVNLHGRGNHFYNDAAETDLFEVLDVVCGAYDVDRTRVFVEGFSMGGTGAIRHIARHADVFAGAASSAGWTDFRQWHRNWYGPAGNPYEVHPALVPHLEQASPLTHAENILTDRLHMGVGGLDTAVWAENGLKLRDRLLRLPVPTTHECVYNASWTHGATNNAAARYSYLAGCAALPPDPASAHVRSNKLRTARAFWLHVDRFAWDGFGEIQADRSPGSECTYTVSTRNVERFSITAPPAGGATRYIVNVDSVPCLDVPAAGASFPITIELAHNGYGAVTSGGAWVPSGSGGLPAKTAPAEGAIAQALSEPFIVAYGSSNPALTAKAQNDAMQFARAWADDFSGGLDSIGSGGYYGLITPVDEALVTRADMAAANLFIFGSRESSARIAQMFEDATLPWNLPSEIEVIDDRITFGGQVFDGAADDQRYGIWMVYPNPLAPGKLVVIGHNLVGSGVDSNWGEILWTQDSWAWKWPDYIVFDSAAPFTIFDRQGDKYVPEQYLIAGDFDRDWRLRSGTDPRTDVAVSTDSASYTAGAGATATVTVDVTNELSVAITGLPGGAFEFRVDGELRAATLTGGSYTFTLPLTDLLQYASVDTDQPVTSYALTVEVVRPHPSTGKPLAGLGRGRFAIQ
jgi:hypothetical protein